MYQLAPAKGLSSRAPPPLLDVEELLLEDELELLEDELELLLEDELDELELLLEDELDELELLLEDELVPQLDTTPPSPLWLSQVVRPIQL